MEKSNRTVKKSFLPFLSIIALACAVFLPVWTVTMELEDIKYIFAICAPVGVLILLKRTNNERNLMSDRLRPNMYPVIFGAFLLYSLCNWYFLSYPYYGTRSMVYLWFCFLSFLLGVFFLSNQKFLSAFLFGIIVCGLIASLYSVGEFFAVIRNNEPQRWPPRITGLFAHKNAFAFFILNSSIWTAYFMVSLKKKKLLPLIILALCVQLYALFISNCRVILLLAIVGYSAVFLPLLYKRGLLRRRRVRYSFYGIFSLCAMLFLLFGSDFFWLRAAQLVFSTDVGIQGRQALYGAEWRLFLSHPLFGCGVGNFVFENVPFWSEKFRHSTSALISVHNAESDFLETLLETGAIGFIFYCFFLFGAVVLGIRSLKREWKWETYIILALVVLMLCNGIYDTPIRRLPCGILLWSFVGFLWRDPFRAAWQGYKPRHRFYIKGLAAALHCVLAFFFIRILAGDFFYMQSYITLKNPNPQSGKEIKRALSVCPFHPDALFQAGFLGVRTGEYRYAMQVADLLDQTAPHYRPTSFVKGLCALRQERNADALMYANEEIRKNPNYIESYELKMNALSRLGKCREFSRLRDSLCIGLREEKDFLLWGDTVSQETLSHMFKSEIGSMRAFLGGRRLRQAYHDYLHLRRRDLSEFFDRLHRFSRIPCSSQTVR